MFSAVFFAPTTTGLIAASDYRLSHGPTPVRLRIRTGPVTRHAVSTGNGIASAEGRGVRGLGLLTRSQGPGLERNS